VNAILQCSDVTAYHGRRAAVRNLSLTIAPGEFVVLLGANGAGKTSVLHLLLGLLPARHGTVTVCGHPAGRLPRAVRRRLGYMPQQRRSADCLPLLVKDVVSLGRSGAGLGGLRSTRADRHTTRAAMREAGVSHLAERPLEALSGGERQRVELARVLCQGAEILLLDEPAAALDLGGRCELFDLVQDLHQARGMTVLMVLHDLASLPGGCRRAIVLDSGTPAWDGAPNVVFTPPLMERIYGDNAMRVLQNLNGMAAR